MIGPSYGEWWNERPATRRVRAFIVAVPVIALALWAIYMLDARVNTEIFSAVNRGDLEEVRELLERGASADMNASSKLYGTPLHWAAEAGQSATALILIEQGADAITRDHHNLTPSARARESGHPRLVGMLSGTNTDEVNAAPQITATSKESASKECDFPRRMHKASRLFLDAYVGDNMSLAEFRRRFSLPNSDYVALASCLIGGSL